MYENFVEEIDAIDNGVNQYDGESLYKITTNLSARVGRLNPKWNEDNTDENVRGVQDNSTLIKNGVANLDYFASSLYF